MPGCGRSPATLIQNRTEQRIKIARISIDRISMVREKG
jgi:hypothetical protein